ncbi:MULTISPECIES: hypothetical protein [Bradyrhizobium]|jgi:hypothetical protein|uniref:Uncharacterized protein n=1 Tax=Bradyrhizobium septentrionale TaxID=1404411 RepID=A0A973W6P7_9BRAD|nr:MULTISPECIES: hypothetical protein [Bradyrhizobium]MCK7667782.1 hypothetical protein [Bradyrhizobium sp. 2S1]UGY16698.1 hypothetical protein HAP48_0003865 [Bradyrhizobium septentrionale]UGY25356.1 hypothetical protein HU675_0047225 [Bradyrhizobium septentrionale]
MRVVSSIRVLLRSAAEGLFKFLAWIGEEPISVYRPEAHYMRGPGPAWRAKHQPGQVASLRRVR